MRGYGLKDRRQSGPLPGARLYGVPLELQYYLQHGRMMPEDSLETLKYASSLTYLGVIPILVSRASRWEVRFTRLNQRDHRGIDRRGKANLRRFAWDRPVDHLDLRSLPCKVV